MAQSAEMAREIEQKSSEIEVLRDTCDKAECRADVLLHVW